MSRIDLVKNFLYGMVMGFFDLIPGISGGTIAFLLGIYETLIESVKSITSLKYWKSLFRLLNPYSLQNPGKYKNSSGLSRKEKTKASESKDEGTDCLDSSRGYEICLSEPCEIGFHLQSSKFLIPLLFGIIVSVLLFSKLLKTLLNIKDTRMYLHAVFFGFILASSMISAKKISKWKASHYFLLIISTALMYILIGFNMPNDHEGSFYEVHIPKNIIFSPNVDNYDKDTEQLKGVSLYELKVMYDQKVIDKSSMITDSSGASYTVNDKIFQNISKKSVDFWIIICGILSIAAMLLPGISGSYMLTILGAYPMVIGAIADMSKSIYSFQVDTYSLSILLNFGFGMIVGAALCIRLLSWLLSRYHEGLVSILIGMMLGSLRSIWPFWESTNILLPTEIYKSSHLKLLHPIWPEMSWDSCYMPLLVIMVSFVFVMIIEMKCVSNLRCEANSLGSR